MVQILAVVVAVVLDRFVPGAGKTAGDAIRMLVNTGRSMAIAATSNAAGQGAAMAAGIQDKFSWNQVALSAISAGVGQLDPGGAIAARFNLGGYSSIFVTQSVNSAVSQAIGTSVGAQDKFSWAGAAAAGVGAMAGEWASRRVPGAPTTSKDPKTGKVTVTPPTVFNDVVRSTASLIANAATRSLIEGSDFGDNVRAALPDVIGQTIGNAIAGGISGKGGSAAKQLAQVGKTPLTAFDVAAACGVPDNRSFWDRVGDFFSDVGDTLGFDGRFGFDGTREARERAALAPYLWPADSEEIVVTAWLPMADGQGYVPYIPYNQRPESERTYASAGQPYTYWGNVGNNMQRGWNSAWSNFQHEFGAPTSVSDAFRRGLDPLGTRYIGATLNLAFQPISNGVGAMAQPIMPDSDAEWMFIQQNRDHPSIFDPQHVMTGQEQRDLFGAGVVTLATARVPIGRLGATESEAVVWNNGWRTADGRFAGVLGGETPAYASAVDDLAAALQAEGRSVRTGVYKPTLFGPRFVDIEVSMEGRVLGGIEVKTGSSSYLPSQQAKDTWLWLMEGYRTNTVRYP